MCFLIPLSGCYFHHPVKALKCWILQLEASCSLNIAANTPFRLQSCSAALGRANAFRSHILLMGPPWKELF